jgi:ABC-type uncharacterized transport system involved in gliding motility auxiliary subunit
LVQNRFPFATKTFSKIRGILELNQTKSANRRTDTDGRINEVRALPLGKWERINLVPALILILALTLPLTSSEACSL